MSVLTVSRPEDYDTHHDKRLVNYLTPKFRLGSRYPAPPLDRVTCPVGFLSLLRPDRSPLRHRKLSYSSEDGTPVVSPSSTGRSTRLQSSRSLFAMGVPDLPLDRD